MKFKKLKVEDSKFELNLKFYFWLKHLVKTKLTENQSNDLLEIILRHKNNFLLVEEKLDVFLENLKGVTKKEAFSFLISTVEEKDLDAFIFALRLYMIKDLLLQEAKLSNAINTEEMAKLDRLSLKYDEKSVYAPYSTRVNGALLALLFFEKVENGETDFISENSMDYIASISKDAIKLKKIGLEPNQIFMLMFSESINQSIISDSGSNYEDRILDTLITLGVKKENIKKCHDKDDKSTEFDFFFEIDGRVYGIGAKRTLRERYKQFIKTALSSEIDVMIEITLGLDLNKNKAEIILSHGTKIFVSNEIYENRDFLRELDGVYSVKDLTLETLKKL